MFNLNILPPRYRKKKKKVKVNLANPTYGLAILGTVVASCIFLTVQLELRSDNINEEIVILEGELTEIQTTASIIEQQINQITNYKSEIQRMKNADFSLGNDPNMGMGGGEIIAGGIAWDYMLDEVAATTIPEATIKNVKQSETSSDIIEIGVETYTLSNMAKMKQSFEDSKYFADVETSNIKQNNTNLIARPNEVSFTLSFRYIEDPNKPQPIEGEINDPYANGNMNDPYANGTDPYANGTDPYANGTDPYANGTDPYANGTDPYANGTDPYANGGNQNNGLSEIDPTTGTSSNQ